MVFLNLRKEYLNVANSNYLTADKELDILICETPSEVIVYQQELLTAIVGPPCRYQMSRCRVA